MQIIASPFFILSSLFVSILLCASFSRPEPAEAETEVGVYIIYTNQPENIEPMAFHIKILTAVLVSEEAAKKALLYSYNNAMSGFAAKLTPDQVKKISEQPGVLHVIPSRTYQLDTEPGKPNF